MSEISLCYWWPYNSSYWKQSLLWIFPLCPLYNVLLPVLLGVLSVGCGILSSAPATILPGSCSSLSMEHFIFSIFPHFLQHCQTIWCLNCHISESEIGLFLVLTSGTICGDKSINENRRKCDRYCLFVLNCCDLLQNHCDILAMDEFRWHQMARTMLLSHLNVKVHRILTRCISVANYLHTVYLLRYRWDFHPFFFFSFWCFPLCTGCFSLSSNIFILPWIFTANQIKHSLARFRHTGL